jgi:hypothetical protein
VWEKGTEKQGKESQQQARNSANPFSIDEGYTFHF